MTAEAEEQKPPTQPTAAPPHHSLPEEWAVEVMSVTVLMSSSTDTCCRSWNTTRWLGGTTTSTEAAPLQVTECGLGGGQATRAENPDGDTVVCLRMGMVMTVGAFHRGHVEWVRDNVNTAISGVIP